MVISQDQFANLIYRNLFELCLAQYNTCVHHISQSTMRVPNSGNICIESFVTDGVDYIKSNTTWSKWCLLQGCMHMNLYTVNMNYVASIKMRSNTEVGHVMNMSTNQSHVDWRMLKNQNGWLIVLSRSQASMTMLVRFSFLHTSKLCRDSLNRYLRKTIRNADVCNA